MLEDVVGHVERVVEVPPGVDVDEFVLQERDRGARPPRRRGAQRPAEPGQRARSGCRTRATPSGSRSSSLGERPDGRLLRQADRAEGRAGAARGDAAASTRALVVVGFGPYRATLEATAPPRTLFTGPLEHRHLVNLLPLADATVVPSIFPEAFGMVAAEAAAAGSPPLVARHSGLAEVAAGLEEAYPERFRHLASFESGDADDLARKLNELVGLSPVTATSSRAPRAEPSSSAGRGRESPGACSARSAERPRLTSAGMGDEQRVSWQELLERNRAEFEAGTDFTLAVEEEFALLDPQTLELTDRFEELYAAAPETELAPNIVGELIASEVEVRTGRCADFAEAAAAMQERRSQLHGVARDLRLALGGTGTHPWSRWQDQRIIDTPHYRRNDELLRYVVWRNNTFGLHVHVGIARRRPRDRRARRAAQLPARAARAVGELAVRRGRQLGPALGAHRDLHAHVPALRHPGRLRQLAGLGGLRLVPLPHRLDHRAHADLVERAAAPRLPDGRDPDRDGQPDLAEAQSLAALCYALAARCARAYDEGEPLPDLPHRLLEENMWRAIRYGLSGELLDFERGEPVPARARIEQLLEWVAPVADEIGAAPFLAVPEQNAAERQIARFEEGASLEEIYAEQVRAGEPIGG